MSRKAEFSNQPPQTWFSTNDYGYSVYSPEFDELNGGNVGESMRLYQRGNANILGELGDARRPEPWEVAVTEPAPLLRDMIIAEALIQAATNFPPADLEIARLKHESANRLDSDHSGTFASPLEQHAFLQNMRLGPDRVAESAKVYLTQEFVDQPTLQASVENPLVRMEAVLNIVSVSETQGGFGATIMRNGESVVNTWSEFSGGIDMGAAAPALDRALGFGPAFATNLIDNTSALLVHYSTER